mmetsp:Transcript_32342/g.54816  ORF Transcript_32342/g.54816 Transcript_32342/m.54816 type:complete len:520 (+) Transcript_32342:164-1723(+)
MEIGTATPTDSKATAVEAKTEVNKVENGVVFKVANVEVSKFKLPPLPTKLCEVAVALIGGKSACIEASSFSKQKTSGVYCKHAFIATCLNAYARHLPLALRPDDIWSVISFGLAKHIEMNSEALKSKLVKFKGKKKLKVRVDHFIMGATSPDDWEKDVFPDFSSQIKNFIGKDTHSIIASPFSTSTSTDIVSHEIALMAATKKYFNFTMETFCGIPSVRLEGKLDDWRSLRSRAEALGKLMTAEFKKYWLPNLLPVLDQFVEAFQGNVNQTFWSHMVKHFPIEKHSGSHPWISGWVNNLYPYVKRRDKVKVNKYMAPWKKWTTKPKVRVMELPARARDRSGRPTIEHVIPAGPNPCDFPATISSVKVTWDYYFKKYPLRFCAGISAIGQDDDGYLRPLQGWVVTHVKQPLKNGGDKLKENGDDKPKEEEEEEEQKTPHTTVSTEPEEDKNEMKEQTQNDGKDQTKLTDNLKVEDRSKVGETTPPRLSYSRIRAIQKMESNAAEKGWTFEVLADVEKMFD